MYFKKLCILIICVAFLVTQGLAQELDEEQSVTASENRCSIPIGAEGLINIEALARAFLSCTNTKNSELNQSLVRSEIIQFGIYQASRLESSVHGRDPKLSGVEHVSWSTTVPFKTGLIIGFQIDIHGVEEISSDKITVNYYKPSQIEGQGGEYVLETIESSLQNGSTEFILYDFTSEKDRALGVWIIEAIYRGQMVGYKRFTITQ